MVRKLEKSLEEYSLFFSLHLSYVAVFLFGFGFAIMMMKTNVKNITKITVRTVIVLFLEIYKQ